MKSSAAAPYEVLIVGAGFAGLSTAYHLSRAGARRVLVLEKSRAAGLHASGKNAGMIRQAVPDPATARLCREGRDALLGAARAGWKGVEFGLGGSLLLASGPERAELKDIREACRAQGIVTRALDRAQALKRSPLLQGAVFDEALFCPSDFLVDIRALLKGFLAACRRAGVRLVFGRSIRSVSSRGGLFEVVTEDGLTFRAKTLVNAAGAWAPQVAAKAGASSMPLTAYRRHLYLSKGFRPWSKDWPFVWDLSASLYFRPVREGLLVSPCDKKALKPSAATKRSEPAERTDPVVEADLRSKIDRFAPRLRGIRLHEKKAALRTMTPDGRFLIGEDPKLKRFFWVAGLGGHGVTTSFSVGRLAAGLILGRRSDRRRASPFAPSRFVKRVRR